MNHSQQLLGVLVDDVLYFHSEPAWQIPITCFLLLFTKVASLHSSLRFLKVVCLSCSKLELHLPDDFHVRLLASTLHFLKLLERNKNSVNETPKNSDSNFEKENGYRSRVTVEQGKGSWSDDVVEQGYCLVVSLLEGCDPLLLPELLDGLGDEIVSCPLSLISFQSMRSFHRHIYPTNWNTPSWR